MIHEGLAKLVGGAHGTLPGVSGLTYSEAAGGNVFMGFLPPSPNRAVAFIPTGGFDADSRLPYSHPSVQVLIRGDEDARWALDTWQALFSKLQGLRRVTLNDDDSTYVVSVIALQSGPVHIGKDENRRVQYALNLQAEVLEPTAERPA